MSETPGSKILGYFAMHYEGVYIPGQDYTFLSLVIYAGGLWLCIKKTGTVNVDPGSNDEVWVLSSTSAATAEYLDVINTLHGLDESFDTRLQQANDAKSAAEAAKTEALGSASQAAGSAQAAQIDKDAAQVAAGQAQISANEAAGSANDANASKLAAQSAAGSAQGSATAAAESKSAAESAMAGAQEAQAAAEQTAADFEGIVNLVGAGNPNLMHNADFRNPVNQRGVSGSVSYNGYFYDRWIRYDQPSTSAIILGAGYITLPVGVILGQNIEGLLLGGKTVTLSIMLSNGSIHTHTNAFPSSGSPSGTVNSGADSLAYYKFRRDPTSMHVQIVPASAALNIACIKLELGTVSTIHLDPPMDHAAELAKCQRYLKPLPRGSGRLFNLTSSVVELAWDLTPPMRIAPSLYIPSLTNSILIQGVGLYTPTSFTTWEGNNPNLFVVKFNGTYGGSNPGTFLYATGCFAIAEI